MRKLLSALIALITLFLIMIAVDAVRLGAMTI